MGGRRLMVFDRTCGGWSWPSPYLTEAWRLGAALHRARGKLDATRGVASWAEAIEWIEHAYPDEAIAEIQFWGHGKWGRAMVNGIALDKRVLTPDHSLHPRMEAIRERMAPEARWWFRTCETLGAEAGHEFAQRWSDFFGRPVAGHTYIIGPWQSGLHELAPGQRPDWDVSEGLKEGTPAEPKAARWSTPFAPNTIGCLRVDLPRSLASR